MDTALAMDTALVYPETLILVVTSHGRILTETNAYSGDVQPKTVALPAGMTVVKISAVSSGTCNFLSAFAADVLVKNIAENVQQHTLWLQTNVASFAKSLAKQLDSIDRPNLWLYPDTDTDVKDYTYQRAKRYTVSTATGTLINKEYVIDTSSADVHKQGYLNKIILLNLPGGMQDFFAMMYIDTTDVQELVDFFEEKGVKTVILVDLTCSNYDDAELNARDIRALRYASERTGLRGGGGKT